MSWYEGTYSCGHSGRVNIIGPTKDRQYKADRNFDGMCPECYEKWKAEDLERRTKEALALSKEMELPELNGSEKQVNWAASLRIKVVNDISDLLDRHNRGFQEGKKLRLRDNEQFLRVTKDEIIDAADFAYKNYVDARFWIDNRFLSCQEYIVLFIKEMKKNILAEIPQEVQIELTEEQARLTIKPVEETHSGIVETNIDSDGNLTVYYIKEEEFRNIVRDKQFKWNGRVWVKEISEFTGSAEERCSELGNILLANGYTVRFYNDGARDRAISGDFTSENNRWIKWNDELNSFSISWGKNNDSLFTMAKKIPGAKWHKGRMIVPLQFYKEVQDFAEMVDFCFSKRAMEAIESYSLLTQKFCIENVKENMPPVSSVDTKLKDILKKTGSIIEDLQDEA